MIALIAGTYFISVLSANASVLERTLQIRSFFDSSREEEAIAFYLVRDIEKSARGADELDLYGVRRTLVEKVADLKASHRLFRSSLPDAGSILDQDPVRSGEVFLDIGDCRVRYFNPGIASRAPPEGFTVVREDLSLSEYLARQLLVREPFPEGSGIAGPYLLDDIEFLISVTRNREEMLATIERWLAELEDNYFSRTQWRNAVEVCGIAEDAFMLKIESDEGELLGLSIDTRKGFPFPEGIRSVWRGEIAEIRKQDRGKGLGRVMMARRLRIITQEVKENNTFTDTEGEEFLLPGEADAMDHIYIIQPAEDEEYAHLQGGKRAVDFYSGLGFRRMPVTWMGMNDDDEQAKDLWMSVSFDRAESIIENAGNMVEAGFSGENGAGLKAGEPSLPRKEERDELPDVRMAHRSAGKLFYRHPYSSALMSYDTVNNREILKNIEDSFRGRRTAERLVQALIGVEEMAHYEKRKVILALDLQLGEVAFRSSLEMITGGLFEDNPRLRSFLNRVHLVAGKGKDLSRRLRNISTLSGQGRNKVRPRDMIILTDNKNYGYFSDFRTSTVAGIDRESFEADGYFPITEILLFTLGKHLGWDVETLKGYYEAIPNVSRPEELGPAEMTRLFGPATRKFVIRLIPDAVPFDEEEKRELLRVIRHMLSSA
jgi:hypothetical protein